MNGDCMKYESGEMVCLIQYLRTFFLPFLEFVSYVASTLLPQQYIMT